MSDCGCQIQGEPGYEETVYCPHHDPERVAELEHELDVQRGANAELLKERDRVPAENRWLRESMVDATGNLSWYDYPAPPDQAAVE